MLELTPRRVAGHALLPVVDEHGLHDVQARRTEHDGLLGRHAQKLAGQATRRGDALEAAVVGAVDTLVGEVGIAAEQVEHGTGDVHLGGRRLAARHIERQALGLDLVDLRPERSDRRIELGRLHLLVHRLHDRALFPFRVTERGIACVPRRSCSHSSHQYTRAAARCTRIHNRATSCNNWDGPHRAHPRRARGRAS